MPKTAIADYYITCIWLVENISYNVDVWNGTSNDETNLFYWSLTLDIDKFFDDQSPEPMVQVN